MAILLALLLVFSVFDHTIAIEKTWIHTTLWNDVLNWQPPHLPCADGTVHLSDGVVFISNITLPSEIILSSNSEIIFDANSEIPLGQPVNAAPDASNPNCGKNFLPVQHSWHNPLNWKSGDERDTGIPYIERIPCHEDDVVFPEHNSFVAKMSRSVSVNSVQLRGKKLTENAELQSYLSSEDEKDNFIYENNAKLSVQSDSCPKAGCICEGYTDKTYNQMVCDSFQCPKIDCPNLKVKPTGDCCSHCGCTVDFKFNSGFDLEKCQQAMINYTSHISRTEFDKVQILLFDNQQRRVTNEMVDEISRLLQQQGHPCMAKSKSVIKGICSGGKGSQSGNENAGTIAMSIVIPIIALTILIIILVVVYRRHRRIASQREHKEFKNPDDIMEYPGMDQVDMRTTDFMSPYDHIVEVKSKEDGAQSFSNPSYAGNDFEDGQDENFNQSVVDINFSNFFNDPNSNEMKDANMFKTSSFGNPLYDALIDDKKPPQNENEEEEINHRGNEAVLQNEADVENQAKEADADVGDEANFGDGSGGLDNPLYSEVFAAFSEKDEE